MVSSKLSVGIHILTVLAWDRAKAWTSEQISQSVNTNPVVIRRLLGLLREAGVVDSKAGVGGGWVLLAEPEAITFLDVLRAVEPQSEAFALPRSEPNPLCRVGCDIQAVLCEIYAEVEAGMAQRLDRSTIAEVIAKLRAQKTC